MRTWDEYLVEALRDSKEAAAYLNAAIEENDPEVLGMALANLGKSLSSKDLDLDVARAARGMTDAAPLLLPWAWLFHRKKQIGTLRMPCSFFLNRVIHARSEKR
jgi:hypothetical protein